MSAARETILALSSAALPIAAMARNSGGPSGPPGSIGASGLGRAILRLSGSAATELGERVFHSRERLTGVRSWRRIAGEVRWSGHAFPACVYVMRGPRSYTREDVVEIHMPGLRWLVESLMDELLRAGARLALPGEFTRRAVENGRINLEQAETVGALIRARSADEARAFAARLSSDGARARSELKNKIEELLSLVELGLDFATEDVTVISRDEMLARAEALQRACEEQSAGSATGESRVQTEGLPRVLLLGPVNAGKSTLFNALLGRDAAIISPQRHTTRDTLEAPLDLDGQRALLIDSAGAGEELSAAANSEFEAREYLRQAAWNATLNAIRCADVVLVLFDSADAESSVRDAALLLPALAQCRSIALAVVWTKSDAAAAALRENLPPELKDAPSFQISAQTGAGLNELRAFVNDQLRAIGARPRDAALEALAVTRNAARTAAAALARVVDALRLNHGEDVVAVELREALHAFWQAEGVLIRHDAVTESALDRIFSSFCIGK